MTAPSSNYLAPVFFGSTAFVFLNFGMPIYLRDQQVDAAVIGGMYTVFTATLLLFRPAVGWALDRFGRRRFFAAAFAFYAVAMALFSGAESVFDFYVARFLQGMGASLMWVSARTIVADAATGRQGAAMGELAAMSVRGSMVGATYGFTLVAMMPFERAWTLAFVGYASAAALGWLLATFRFREPPGGPEVDTLPALTLGIDVRRLLTIALLTGFASALIEPVYLIYLRDKYDLSVIALAGAFFPAGLVFALLPRYAGGWSDRWGRGRLLAAGIAGAGIVSGALPWLPGLVAVALAYTLFAAGWATAGPAQDALLSDLAPAGGRGRLFGWKEAAASLGASLGPLVGGALYDHVAEEAAFVLNGLLLLTAAALAARWFGWTTSAAPGR